MPSIDTNDLDNLITDLETRITDTELAEGAAANTVGICTIIVCSVIAVC
ncbi:hypothetical protein ABZX40_16000 [Streptomyces sp. NPDC004610]